MKKKLYVSLLYHIVSHISEDLGIRLNFCIIKLVTNKTFCIRRRYEFKIILINENMEIQINVSYLWGFIATWFLRSRHTLEIGRGCEKEGEIYE